ncbi:MAG: hypothetical protein ABSB01_09560 [Streptosporangiaceae bacterium]|jgi:hypothetical protein
MISRTPEHVTNQSEPAAPEQDAGLAVDWRAFRTANRSCCCSARPAVIVVMAPVPGRDHPTELLLCGHHYRVSSKALAAAGAVVLDGGAIREEAISA